MRMGVSMVAILCLTAGNLVAQVEETNVDIKAPNGTLKVPIIRPLEPAPRSCCCTNAIWIVAPGMFSPAI